MTGHGNVVFSRAEAENLRTYLLSGGFLHIDDNYGMDEYIRKEIKKVFPNEELREIPISHEIFQKPYNFPNGLPKIHEHDNNNLYKQFKDLIGEIYTAEVHHVRPRVVILIDEYDKPIIDNISDKEMATVGRNALASFYSAIKSSDEYLKFVFMTGVSKFSKMNLFSTLNNLDDITLNKKYATITGYTHQDVKERIEVNNIKRKQLGHYLGAVFAYEGECYWSIDRLPFLEERLKHLNVRKNNKE